MIKNKTTFYIFFLVIGIFFGIMFSILFLQKNIKENQSISSIEDSDIVDILNDISKREKEVEAREKELEEKGIIITDTSIFPEETRNDISAYQEIRDLSKAYNDYINNQIKEQEEKGNKPVRIVECGESNIGIWPPQPPTINYCTLYEGGATISHIHESLTYKDEKGRYFIVNDEKIYR